MMSSEDLSPSDTYLGRYVLRHMRLKLDLPKVVVSTGRFHKIMKLFARGNHRKRKKEEER
jgi:hypothetical protein